MVNKIVWPDNKDFVFTIFDDTDRATLANVKDIYSFLTDCGLRTTKSVWPIKGKEPPRIPGETCEDDSYLSWLLELQNKGFEIGYHNATFHSSKRQETIRGLETFRELFGTYPKTMANHDVCRENIYWGDARFTGINKIIYNLATKNKRKNFFQGHIGESEYFWGDICKEKIKYVRNFVFNDINTLKMCPFMPYHDPNRPYVNYWFASSEGSTLNQFNHCISERNQDRLVREKGACIMVTHFGKRFYEGRFINRCFRDLVERLSRRNGWFVPVATLLDYLMDQLGRYEISVIERKCLERQWVLSKMLNFKSTDRRFSLSTFSRFPDMIFKPF